jgi:hypothetical protein
MMKFYPTTLLLGVVLCVGIFALLDRGQQQLLLGKKEADNVEFVESGRVRASHATAHVWLLAPSFIHNSSFIFFTFRIFNKPTALPTSTGDVRSRRRRRRLRRVLSRRRRLPHLALPPLLHLALPLLPHLALRSSL